MVDRTALRFNQALIVGLVSLAFLLDRAWLVAFVAGVLLLGTAVPELALFQQIYRRLLRPAGLLRAAPVQEPAAPHRFAQGVGGSVLLLATLALLLNAALLGWLLSLIVVALALVNLLFDFCAGCFIYLQLERAGLLGHTRTV